MKSSSAGLVSLIIKGPIKNGSNFIYSGKGDDKCIMVDQQGVWLPLYNHLMVNLSVASFLLVLNTKVFVCKGL